MSPRFKDSQYPYVARFKDTPEQKTEVMSLLNTAPEKTAATSKLLKWFKEDFLIDQINNKWGVALPATGIGA
jgi:hypothetical protein